MSWNFACLGSWYGQVEDRLDPPDRHVPLADLLVAEAEDLERVVPVLDARQLAGEVLDVDPGAAVDVRRVLVGQDRDPHRLGLRSGYRLRGE